MKRNFDFLLLFTTIAIIVFGCFMIYGAKGGGAVGRAFVIRQAAFACVGLLLGGLCATIDYPWLTKQTGKLYTFNLMVLGALLFYGSTAGGAQRWIGYGAVKIQPSEFAKVIMILALAVFLCTRLREIRTLNVFIRSFVYVLFPLGLIFLQPDLGTSLVLISVWLTMIFVMGSDLRHILAFFLIGAVLAVGAWSIPGVMKDYQKKRVVTFINPESDPKGSGYHVRQSRIAIGSGKLTGKGYMKGTQRELRFIPEQHTDFIFTVVGEELGFAGGAALLLLYLLMLRSAIVIMVTTEDEIGRAISAGVAGMFLFHIIVNVGMTIGIMPVTGVPLPMFSYGGSNMVAGLMAVGLLEGASMRKDRINFIMGGITR